MLQFKQMDWFVGKLFYLALSSLLDFEHMRFVSSTIFWNSVIQYRLFCCYFIVTLKSATFSTVLIPSVSYHGLGSTGLILFTFFLVGCFFGNNARLTGVF